MAKTKIKQYNFDQLCDPNWVAQHLSVDEAELQRRHFIRVTHGKWLPFGLFQRELHGLGILDIFVNQYNQKFACTGEGRVQLEGYDKEIKAEKVMAEKSKNPKRIPYFQLLDHYGEIEEGLDIFTKLKVGDEFSVGNNSYKVLTLTAKTIKFQKEQETVSMKFDAILTKGKGFIRDLTAEYFFQCSQRGNPFQGDFRLIEIFQR
jgi:hypothetical protein